MADQLDAEILEWILLAKGDRPGHDFHGNQYTTGLGAAGISASQSAAAEVPANDPSRYERATSIAGVFWVR